jgi:flagellar FliL protein
VSDKPDAAEPAKAPPKSKKMLLMIVGAVVILALAAGGGWFYLSRQHAAEDGEEEVVVKVEHKGPPTYLPMDNMIVNLADPGGEKIAQVGVTLELSDIKAVDKVRLYLPAIRSDVLLLLSQRTAEELLQREGKEKLSADILREASRHFAESETATGSEKAKKDSGKPKKPNADKKKIEDGPVRGVLFSSFIVQ